MHGQGYVFNTNLISYNIVLILGHMFYLEMKKVAFIKNAAKKWPNCVHTKCECRAHDKLSSG